jgi:hypothetical protein
VFFCGEGRSLPWTDTDAYVASVQRHSVEFEEQTGIALDLRVVPSDLYFSNKIHHLLEGEGAADVYMSGPVLVWEHLAAGFVQPLEEFLEGSSESYEAGDFVERLLACNRWSGRFGDPLGQGLLLEIPVTASRTTSPMFRPFSTPPAWMCRRPGPTTSRRPRTRAGPTSGRGQSL